MSDKSQKLVLYSNKRTEKPNSKPNPSHNSSGLKLVTPNRPTTKKKIKSAREKQKFSSKYDGSLLKSLQKMNPYYQSLKNPLECPGAKIPDWTTYPSSTFQSIYRVTQTANAAGMCGVVFSGPWVRLLAAAATEAAVSWQANAQVAPSTGPMANYDLARLVSACCYAVFLGTSLGNSGRFICNSIPVSGSTAALDSYATEAAWLNLPLVAEVPVNEMRPTVSMYMPSSMAGFDYIDTAAGSMFASLGAASQNYGSSGILVTGLAANMKIEFIVVCNYEGIPASATYDLIHPTPSDSDPTAMSLALNHRNHEELAGVATGKTGQGILGSATAGFWENAQRTLGNAAESALPLVSGVGATLFEKALQLLV